MGWGHQLKHYIDYRKYFNKRWLLPIIDSPRKCKLWLEEYRRRCLTVGRRVKILRGQQSSEAEAVAVDESFGLTVRCDNGAVETLHSGEVSVRGLYGYV